MCWGHCPSLPEQYTSYTRALIYPLINGGKYPISRIRLNTGKLGCVSLSRRVINALNLNFSCSQRASSVQVGVYNDRDCQWCDTLRLYRTWRLPYFGIRLILKQSDRRISPALARDFGPSRRMFHEAISPCSFHDRHRARAFS